MVSVLWQASGWPSIGVGTSRIGWHISSKIHDLGLSSNRGRSDKSKNCNRGRSSDESTNSNRRSSDKSKNCKVKVVFCGQEPESGESTTTESVGMPAQCTAYVATQGN